ncbi:MAG: hypothetical protein ABI123_03390 [Ginsengibacter sp.]|jgi:hypothetical protein
MKKYLLLLFVFAGIISFANAQGNKGARIERVEALKIAFLTQKLQLTSAQAEKFWPVYNQYEDEIQQVRKDNRTGDILEGEQKLLDIRKKYRDSFEKILGSQKINTLYSAEKEFRTILIKRLKERRE